MGAEGKPHLQPPAEKEETSEPQVKSSSGDWSFPTRQAFRFGFVYLGLYSFPKKIHAKLRKLDTAFPLYSHGIRWISE